MVIAKDKSEQKLSVFLKPLLASHLLTFQWPNVRSEERDCAVSMRGSTVTWQM